VRGSSELTATGHHLHTSPLCTSSPCIVILLPPVAEPALASALPRRRSLRDRPCQGTAVRDLVALRASRSRATTLQLHPHTSALPTLRATTPPRAPIRCSNALCRTARLSKPSPRALVLALQRAACRPLPHAPSCRASTCIRCCSIPAEPLARAPPTAPQAPSARVPHLPRSRASRTPLPTHARLHGHPTPRSTPPGAVSMLTPCLFQLSTCFTRACACTRVAQQRRPAACFSFCSRASPARVCPCASACLSRISALGRAAHPHHCCSAHQRSPPWATTSPPAAWAAVACHSRAHTCGRTEPRLLGLRLLAPRAPARPRAAPGPAACPPAAARARSRPPPGDARLPFAWAALQR
jgi:hypothetical protein